METDHKQEVVNIIIDVLRNQNLISNEESLTNIVNTIMKPPSMEALPTN